MGWPYAFVDLTDDQKHARRANLDYYAALAQISALVALAAVKLYFLISRFYQPRPDVDGSSSPHLKAGRLGRSNALGTARATWRKFLWRCSDPVNLGGFYVGRVGDLLAAALWLGWLLLLCFPHTGDDYLHLTKRFGIIAASQLPLHYLLAVKSPYSPLQILTRSSHERLNPYHQLLGRIITILLYLHAAFYLNFYVQKSLLAAKLKEFYVLCGVAGVLAFTAVGATALAPVRKWSYRVFYAVHVISAAAILPILFFHVSHIRIYLYETAAIFMANVALRTLDAKKLAGTVRVNRESRLLEIDIPTRDSVGKHGIRQWRAGQHAYLTLGGGPMDRMFKANPFSVATVPSVDGQVKFVARILGGNTARIAREVSSGQSKRQINVEGPYGVKDHVDQLLQYDRVLLIAGGVGGTFMVPLYRALLSDLSPSKGSYRRQKVTFLWTVRSMGDIGWALPGDSAGRDSFVERLRLYLTGPTTGMPDTANANFSRVEEDDDDDVTAYAETEEGIEMEQRTELLSQHVDDSRPKEGQAKGRQALKVHAGRPDLRRVIERIFSHSSSEKVAVFVCGPTSLGRMVRAEIQGWAESGRDVWFWEETFAL